MNAVAVGQPASSASITLDRQKEPMLAKDGATHVQPFDEAQFEYRVKAIHQRIDIIKELLARERAVADMALSAKPDTNPPAIIEPNVANAPPTNHVADSVAESDPAMIGPSRDVENVPASPPEIKKPPRLPADLAQLSDVPPSVELADTLFLTGNFQQALKCYEALLADRQDAATQNWLKCQAANCYRMQKEFGNAERLYRDVVSSKDKSMLSEHAKWYLDHVDRRKRIQTQLQAALSELDTLTRRSK